MFWLYRQPPSGGCVLKPISNAKVWEAPYQPPSGGCVLKPFGVGMYLPNLPAAFGRLCVETTYKSISAAYASSATFKRLYVEVCFKFGCIILNDIFTFGQLHIKTRSCLMLLTCLLSHLKYLIYATIAVNVK